MVSIKSTTSKQRIEAALQFAYDGTVASGSACAGVELRQAVASTGGRIMPPIMGAAAFLMPDYLGVSYINVASAAIIGAIVYFLSAGVGVAESTPD